ncbi:MAG: hypothetical protein ABSA67_17470 [Candidatus Brocadiia bacterium]|jgi:hypothetical protein
MRKHRQNWLDIFSGFRVALDARKIILGTLGAYATIFVVLGFLSVAGNWWPGAPGLMVGLLADPFTTVCSILRTLPGQCCANVHALRDPATCCMAFQKLAFLAAGGIVLLFIWSFFGGAIARIAALDFAHDERPQIGQAIAFSSGKFGSFFWSPIVPLIFVAVLLLCNVLLGVVGRIPGAGPIIMGLFYALAAVSAFLVVLLLIGTVFGSLFMWPTIAMEGTDAFDAISRAFNYLYARPWKTLWCVLVAAVYGLAVLLFVTAFAGLLLYIAEQAVAAGMGYRFARIGFFLRWGAPADGTTVPQLWAAMWIKVVRVTVVGLVLGYWASYKISAMTIIYSVLRRDVDGTDMNEVFLPEPEEETPAEPPAEPKPETAAGEQPKSE